MRCGDSGADRDVDHEQQAEAGSGSCGWGCVVAQDRHLLPTTAATRIPSLKTGVSTLETRADPGPQVHPNIETRGGRGWPNSRRNSETRPGRSLARTTAPAA